MKKHFKIILFVLSTLFASSILAQTQELPEIEGWLDDQYYLVKRKNDEGIKQIWKVDAKSGEAEIYQEKLLKDLVAESLPEDFSMDEAIVFSENYEKIIFDQNNDLFYFDKKEMKQLTDDEAAEQNPTFSPDHKKIAYTKENDLYVTDLQSGKTQRLTFDGSDEIKNGYSSWVYYEEIHGRETNYKTFWWSPDSKMIAFERFDDGPVPIFMVYDADGVHGEWEKQHYPKAGDPNPGVKLGVIHLEKNYEITWIDDNNKEDVYIAFPMWAANSKTLVYQKLNRDQDHIEIIAANPMNADTKKIYDETQETWIDFFDDLYLFEDGSGFILRSDKSGWQNLYYHDMDGNLKSQLTNFDWRIKKLIGVDEENDCAYFSGTGNESTNTNIYRVKTNGKKFRQLTNTDGTHEADFSPGYAYFIDNFSNIKTPPLIDLYKSNGKYMRNIAMQSESENPLAKAELFRIPTEDGFELPAYWLRPYDLDTNKKYGVIFTIYGGPNFRAVKNEYHNPSGNLFTRNDIITFAVDHRASGHFGKEGLNYLHRNLTEWELKDYIEAVKWLKKHDYIDSTKIGITGGSYGGTMSLAAITKGSDYFTHSFAQSAVTDWRLYDNIYTERYMDHPDDNPEGYENTSLMNYANLLKGKLFINHGMMDDNVHMQNMIQFIDKLTDLNLDFEMMIYPKARHGWGAPKIFHTFREIQEFFLDDFAPEER